MSGPQPLDMPVLLFDGECGFCTAAVEFLGRRLERRTRVSPWQWEPVERWGLGTGRAASAAWWIEPDGGTFRGADAIAHALLACRSPWRQVGRALTLPGVRALARLGYAGVSRTRRRLPGAVPACRRGEHAFPRVRGAG